MRTFQRSARRAAVPQGLSMLILALILFGLLIGGGAQMLLGKTWAQVDKGMALVAGLVGSFVGGLIFSLIAGDCIKLRASGIIGSLIGAVLVTLVWQQLQKRKA